MNNLFHFAKESDDEHWISVSDLMAGLMMVFLFIAIVFIKDVLQDTDAKTVHDSIQIKDLAVSFKQNEEKLRQRLEEEFEDDFKKWNAELDDIDLTIRFKEPDVFFESGKADLRDEFKEILADFFPRYLIILSQFEESISEVRIEGHTSSEWGDYEKDEAYFKNMGLSQERTRAVLKFNLSLPNISRDKKLAQSLLTANGLSSSKLICNDSDEEGKRIIASDCKEFGNENKKASRRVEFDIRTKVKEKLIEIVERAEK